MSSIQIAGLVYFTVIAIGAWIFFGVIFLQLKRFLNMSCYIPTVSKVLTIILIILTLAGYILILSPNVIESFNINPAPSRTGGNFDTY